MRDLAARGLQIGDSGAAPLAALRTLMATTTRRSSAPRSRLGDDSRVLLIATEGLTA